MSSVEESESLASLAGMVQEAVDVTTGDQQKARKQSASMRRLMSAGKRPELTRKKGVARPQALQHRQTNRLKDEQHSSGS